MIFLKHHKKIDRKRFTKGFLLSFVFLMHFGFAFWVVSLLVNYGEDFSYEKLVASISDSNALQGVLPRASSDDNNYSKLKIVSLPGEIENSQFFEDAKPQESLDIKVASAIAVRVTPLGEKTIFNKDEEKSLPVASLTKLMTALVVLEKYDLNQEVIVSELALKQEGEQGVLKSGDILSVKNLLYIMLIESSNRASFALSEIMGPEDFIETMNQTAKRIGLKNTYFKDSSGLDGASYSTSRDLVVLTRYLFEHYPVFKEIVAQKEFDLYSPSGAFHHKLLTTNKFLGQIENIVGGKTGWTTFSKGCFMIIQENPQTKSYVIYVVLGTEDRFLEMEKLINWVNK